MNMKKALRRTAETPESAVWLLYAGLCDGLRWRRHAVRVATDDVRTLAAARRRAAAGRG